MQLLGSGKFISVADMAVALEFPGLLEIQKGRKRTEAIAQQVGSSP